ncbi:3-isopropylmalate dehydratase large subunit [Achromobacter xylosoxidans]|uniref:3-isopropylmalate dehydratase large subunit n=1 Tax=Alcaligenes xylosoxydans xylosoxydans TaxID=85698 RepID=UPI001F12AF86|nr:3-isopropylmalate dehydratase large subunit [Achromobacter xylosoxidans]
MAPRTLYKKLVDAHTVQAIDAQTVLLYVDLHIMNEYTSPQAFNGMVEQQRGVLRPAQQFAVVDHIIPTAPLPVGQRLVQDPPSRRQAENLGANCTRHGIRLLDVNDPLQGIEHVVAPELGLIRPGMTILCGDSHTTTYGAFGALGFGIGTSEVEHILACQTLVYRLAREMRIRIDGALPAGVTSKDLVLYLLGRIGAQGARGYAVEFCGEAITRLSMEARMTLCNMAVEAGARAALIVPDAKTIDYVLRHAADIAGPHREAALAQWQGLYSDDGADFETEFAFDAAEVAPFITWGTSPDQVMSVDACVPRPEMLNDATERASAERALRYMGLQAGQALIGLAVQRVFIGSCTNGRIEDLRLAAELLRGRRVNPGVRVMIVPGSGMVRQAAQDEGLAQVFLDAGCEWRQPGCSMCLAMNDDVLGDGERCVSTTNRNFEGRQGRGGRTHLVSVPMAAAAALYGHIIDLRTLEHQHD